MAGRVEGKVAFITGAARGQGRAHAVRLAQEGADIIAVDICKPIEGFLNPPSTPEDLARTANLVRGHNRRIVTAEIDVRDYDALKAAVDSGVLTLVGCTELTRMFCAPSSTAKVRIKPTTPCLAAT